ncbi:polysaccharide biosynthesis protein [Blastococcus sp. KM273128]|uniref:hypothetical protein n=1 Tax=Blastococcus sp. KM273128 TaxID=2570314 RepID=UPI001F23170E|nr:hypothetical protein [Blastococcus sp. KM273128]MCF6743787.1 polysaccharide biosynthesis protein [Blastococcus sp. KM273128]
MHAVEPGNRPPEDAAASQPRALGSAALVSVAFLGANALAYVFTVLAARLLAPAAYGELAALLGVVLVGSVPGTGVQTTAALLLGGRDGDRRTTGRLHATALAVGLGVSAVALALVPVLVALLHLPTAGAAVWLALLLLPQTVAVGYQGLLQGAGRFRRLAVLTVAFGAGKLTGGLAGLLVAGSPAGALAGMTAGAALTAAGGWVAAGRPGLVRGLRRPLAASLRAAGALLGLVVLLNLDLLLARHHLPGAASGEYAVASIVAKVAFWLPQGIGVVLLPRLADAAGRHRVLPSALGAVAAVGALLTAGTAALGGAALPLVGGAAYGAALGSAAWLFAALGTLLALAQLLLFSGIAAADRLAGAAVWAAAALEVAVATGLAATGRLTLLSLVATALITALLLVGVGLLRLRRARAVPAVTAGGVVPAPRA